MKNKIKEKHFVVSFSYFFFLSSQLFFWISYSRSTILFSFFLFFAFSLEMPRTRPTVCEKWDSKKQSNKMFGFGEGLTYFFSYFFCKRDQSYVRWYHENKHPLILPQKITHIPSNPSQHVLFSSIPSPCNSKS